MGLTYGEKSAFLQSIEHEQEATAVIRSFETTRDELLRELSQKGLEATEDALKPLSLIDFKALQQVHDHEEAFLRDVFLKSLEAVYSARTGGSRRATEKMTAGDVRNAMMKLGSAVAAADEALIAKKNKDLIRALCPYCGPDKGG